jgi:uncharacterized repeat protein (TIGR02543 family)
VYAKWEEVSGIEYNVSFDLNGGSGSIDSQVIPENGTATEPSNPIQSGYRFVEWQLEGEPFNFATPITGNITLIALWIEQFTVTFDVDGGSSVLAQVVDSGALATQPNPNPTKSGNTFGGWYTTSAKDVIFNFASTAINDNTTIYAKWNPAIYATDLFISEYIEGSSNNKAIEIYNGTGSPINLSSYSVKLFANGATTATATLTLSGTLDHGDVLVLYHGSSVIAISSVGDVNTGSSGVCNFNGDDVIQLLKGSTVIDILGVLGSTTKFGENKTIVRNANIISGNSVYTVSEWTSYSSDTFTYLGAHTANVSNP